MTKTSSETKQIPPRNRWLTGVLGLAAIVAGQVRLASDVIPLSPPLELGIWLNEELHLAVPSIDNVLTGLPLLILGGILFALAVRGLRLLPSESTFGQVRSPSLRVLVNHWYLILAGLGIFSFLLFRLKNPEHQWFQVPFWLTTILIFAFLALRLDQNAKVNLSLQLTRRDLLWVLGLSFIGLIIGTYRLEGFPDQLVGDEGNFWGIARDLANGSFHPSIFGLGVYSFPMFSSLFQAWLIRLFDISLWGWRLSSVLTGLFTIPPLYLFVREAFNRKIAIATTAILICSPYFLAFSRLGYNNIQALFITTTAFYFLYMGLKRKSSLFNFLAGCAAGIGFYVYFSARLVIAAAILFVILMWLIRKVSFREAVQTTFVITVAFFLVALPHLIFGLYHDPQALSYKTFESVFFNTFNGLQFYSEAELYAVAPPFMFSGNELFYHPGIYLEIITRGFVRTLLAFQKPWLITEHYIASPLTGTVGVIFYLIGLTLVLWTARQPRSILLLLWFVINVFGLSALNTVPPRHTHMVSIIPVLAILCALGVYALTRAFASMHTRLLKMEGPLFTLLILIVAVGGLSDYFIKMPHEYRPHPDQVIIWTGLNVQDESLIYIYSDPVEKEFIPDLVKEYRNSIRIHAIAIEEFQNNPDLIPSEQPTIVFYPPEISDKVNGFLRNYWGEDFIGRSFFSSNGTQIIRAGLNAPFTFEQDKSLGLILNETYSHTSLIVLMATLSILFIISATFQAKWITGFPAPIKRISEWFIDPGPPEYSKEEDPLWAVTEFENLYTGTNEEPSIPDEPPEWAHEYLSPSTTPTSRFQFAWKAIKTDAGLDLYLRMKIPRIRNPFQASGEVSQKEPAVILPELHVPNETLLIGSILAAIFAQILISFTWGWAGLAVYLLSALGLFIWGFGNPKWRDIFPFQVQFKPRVEAILFIGFLLFMAFIRFYDLGFRVYGLEADETKWTVQSWYSTILNVDQGEFASMHYDHVPVDFWVRSLFLRVFGLNFISARIESAVLSLISIAFLYLIIRIISRSPSTALLGGILYGLSFIELSASHQALHNTVIEPWIMSAIFFFLWGISKRRFWKFQLAGILLSLGMLTYETIIPTVFLMIAYMFILAGYEIIKRIESFRTWLINIALVLWPIVLTYIGFTREYMSFRQYYIFGWLWKYSENGLGQEGVIHFLVQNITNLFSTLFSQLVFRDSLLNWAGPLLSPMLIPFVVLGFVYNLWNIKRPLYLFLLLWYFSQIIPGPVITGSVLPRVLYTSVGPLIVWGALGLWICFGALRAWSELLSLRFSVPIFSLLLIAILINNYLIFTSSLVDPTDRQIRRELADLTMSSTLESDLILYPYIAFREDAAELESHVILFSVAGPRQIGLEAADYYERIEYPDLLTAMREYRDIPSLDIIIEKTMQLPVDAKEEFVQVLFRCYPDLTQKRSGKFFDVYSINSQAMREPACYHPGAPEPLSPIGSTAYREGSPITFTWDTHDVPMTSFSIQVDRELDDVYWLEAEEVFVGPGWGTTAAFVSDFNGKGFLVDDWESGEAIHLFEIREGSPFRIWVRYYKRRDNDQTNFLNVNGQSIEFAEIGSPLNEWAWKDIGVFNLYEGQNPIGLTRSYGNDEQFSVFVDSIVLTPNTSFNPEFDTDWKTVISTDEIHSNDPVHTFSDSFTSGNYRWKIRIYDRDFIVSAIGDRGIESQFSEFFLVP